PGALLRTIDVMHARLGALTRQFAHEATHGMHPSEARDILRRATEQLRNYIVATGNHDSLLVELASDLEEASAVGWPPRGRQFKATAQVLLHRDDVAKNRSAVYSEEAYYIQLEDRGLSANLVDVVGRIRTDL